MGKFIEPTEFKHHNYSQLTNFLYVSLQFCEFWVLFFAIFKQQALHNFGEGVNICLTPIKESSIHIIENRCARNRFFFLFLALSIWRLEKRWMMKVKRIILKIMM